MHVDFEIGFVFEPIDAPDGKVLSAAEWSNEKSKFEANCDDSHANRDYRIIREKTNTSTRNPDSNWKWKQEKILY